MKIQSRSSLDPSLFDIDYENKMSWVWTTLKVEKFNKMKRIKTFLSFKVVVRSLKDYKILWKVFHSLSVDHQHP